MPYVRTVKTGSGARAVQIVQSSHRGSRNIDHIGSAHDDAELELLKAVARQRLAATHCPARQVIARRRARSRRSNVEVDWIATGPKTRRLSGTERRTTAEEYVARIEALRALGEGYSEVSLAGRAYPRLTLSFRGGYGVVHQFSVADKVFLLAGDGVIANDQAVLVPMLDDIDDARLTGAFVLSVDHAWAAVREFLRHGTVEDLGHWQQL